jgi:hypothetical protein
MLIVSLVILIEREIDSPSDSSSTALRYLRRGRPMINMTFTASVPDLRLRG